MYINKKIKRELIVCTLSIFSIIGATSFLYEDNAIKEEKTILATQVIEENPDFFIDEKDIELDEIVLVIGETNITYEKYQYYLNKEKSAIDNGDISYWDTPQENNQTIEELSSNTKVTKEELETNVLNKMKSIVALEELIKKYNIVVTDEMVEQEYNNIVENYGQTAVDDLIKKENLTISLYKEMIKDSLVEEELFIKMFQKDIKDNIDKTSLAGYRKILVTFDNNIVENEIENIVIEESLQNETTNDIQENDANNNETIEEVTNEKIIEKENIKVTPIKENVSSAKRELSNEKSNVRKLTENEAKTLMDNIYIELSNGTKFEDMLLKYGESDEFLANETKYVQKGILVEPENTKLFELKIGEFSQPFVSELGYEIIIRDEVSDSYIDEHIMDFATDEIWVRYRKAIMQETENIQVVKTESYVNAFANAFQDLNKQEEKSRAMLN